MGSDSYMIRNPFWRALFPSFPRGCQAHLGLGPFGLGPIWAWAHLALDPFGPWHTWAWGLFGRCPVWDSMGSFWVCAICLHILTLLIFTCQSFWVLFVFSARHSASLNNNHNRTKTFLIHIRAYTRARMIWKRSKFIRKSELLPIHSPPGPGPGPRPRDICLFVSYLL